MVEKASKVKSSTDAVQVESDAMVKKTKSTKELKAAKEVLGATKTDAVAKEIIKPFAKAGKRSAKATAEAEEKQTKEARKVSKTAAEIEVAKKLTKKTPPRSRTERAGKKYREVAKLVDRTKNYGLKEALELITNTSPTKFDATVEMHANLGVDPTQSEQNVRGTVILPAGTGKKLRIAVLAEPTDASKAKTAGASLAGNEDILAQLDKEQLDFDILITTPALMPRLGKYARLLGPRGLMPNSKSGTITTDIAKAVLEARAGRVEYRIDQAGIVHAGIGKVSFGADKLTNNVEAILASLRAAKPAGIKGSYIKSVYLATTMGPSIKINLNNS
ncbi:MAG: 50S ribosomal protein L1 [Candidatus Saccharimonadales bacterium]|jgi:large subunit ribosomal protein L1